MGFLFAIGAIVVVLDQITKFLVSGHMVINTAREIIPGLFNLVYVRNTGAAFSLLAGADPSWRQTFFVVMSVLGVAVISIAYLRTPRRERWNRWALALLFGGALGNLVDRVRFGSVVDFLDFYVGGRHWPAFNVADSAISVGAVMLILALLTAKRPARG
jgi:signal peptidase II